MIGVSLRISLVTSTHHPSCFDLSSINFDSIVQNKGQRRYIRCTVGVYVDIRLSMLDAGSYYLICDNNNSVRNQKYVAIVIAGRRHF